MNQRDDCRLGLRARVNRSWPIVRSAGRFVRRVGLGLMWARMARAATSALAAGGGDATFLEAKLATGRYYMARQLPATAMHLARIRSGDAPVMALDAEAF